MSRTIQSPGVEIKEHDLSENPSPAIGTYTFITGFADKGPTDEVLQVTSAEEFEQIYGLPTTPAERYFYHSVTQQFNSPANVLVARLPYGEENGDGFSAAKMYSVLAYPVQALKSVYENGKLKIVEQYTDVTTTYDISNLTNPVVVGTPTTTISYSEESSTNPLGTKTTTYAPISGEAKDNKIPVTIRTSVTVVLPAESSNFSDSNEFIIQKPVHFELTEQEYLDFAAGGFKWENTSDGLTNTSVFSSDIGKAGLIIVNKAQTTINDQYEGYYIGIADNMAVEPKSKYESILSVNSVNDKEAYIPLPDTRMNFTLSADGGATGNSISQIMEDSPSFDIFGSEFDDILVVNVFKLRKSLYADSTIKLDANLSESYTASLDFYRQMQSPNGGSPVSFFLEKKTEDSTDIQVLVNPYLSGKKAGKTWLGDNGKPTKKVRVAFTETQLKNGKVVGGNTEFTSDPKIAGSEDETFDKKYANMYGLSYDQAVLMGKSNEDDNESKQAADGLFALGIYQSTKPDQKVLGSIPQKLSRILSKIDNRDLFELDITVEAGLGTIWSYYKAAQVKYIQDKKYDASNLTDEQKEDIANNCEFDDEFDAWKLAEKGNWFKTGQDAFDANGGADGDILVNWRTIDNIFLNFASNDRKDHIHIADPLRFIFLQGANTKTLSNKSRNFSQHIFWPLKYQFMAANTSYAATYGNWGKVYDAASDSNIWVPMSGALAMIYANTDSNYYCWYAPAGPDRGVLTTVTDIAFSPALKQRDQLYKISVNPIYQDPNMGFVVFGQKTLQSKPSAFDRINVRRLFLYLEKSTYNTIKWFVFRNNTYSTRMAVVNTLDPIFRSCLNNEGCYDYRIVCDARNNTADVIDANELKVGIYIAPARTSEFILCDFYATKTGTNFDEIIK